MKRREWIRRRLRETTKVSEQEAAVSMQGDREIIISRVLDAPRSLVWRAWTDPDQIAKWWGPFGFSTTTASMDCREGGVWRFVMHGPDGTDYQEKIVYYEVVEPERLVYAHLDVEKEAEPEFFRTVVTFVEHGEKTKLTMRLTFESTEERDRVIREHGAVEGGFGTITRLAEHVATLSGGDAGSLILGSPNDRQLVMRRVFNAPQRLVFDALTKPELIKQWLLGPPGTTMPVCEVDLRVGGEYRYVWRNTDGVEMGVRGTYREITPPDRLVHTERFDESWYPGESIVTTELAQDEGRTIFTATLQYESREARDMVMASPMEDGVAASYDRLASIVE